MRAKAAFLVAASLAAGLPWALKLAADNDLWWHLRTGQLILAEHALPESDPFSFTAAGAPWTNHEWLSDVVLALVYDAGGDVGLSLLRACFLLAAFTALAASLWRRLPEPAFVLAALLVVSPIVRTFVTLRPHSWTWLFTLLLFLILDASVRRRHLLWLVPPLMMLWTNLHGGFLLGLALFGVGLVARWSGLERAARRPDHAERRLHLAAAALTAVAPLVNPYGVGLVGYLARELGANHSLILEWRGIWEFADYRLAVVLAVVVPLLAAGAAIAVAIEGRRGLPGLATPFALYALATFCTWRHGRFLILLVLASCLTTFAALPAVLGRLRQSRRLTLLERLRSPGWSFALVAVPLAAGLLQVSADYRRNGLRLGIDPARVPVLACEFLKRHDLGPNLVLRLDWGGYAIWHLYPRYRVSADGRNLTVYDEAFVDGQLQAYDHGKFAEFFSGHEVNAILVESEGPAYGGLARNEGWLQVYGDALAAVFVPRGVGASVWARAVPSAELQSAEERFLFP